MTTLVKPALAHDYALYVWTFEHPRPDPKTTEHNGQMVHQFAVDFHGRELASITRQEAQEWAYANAGSVRYVRAMVNDAIRDGLLELNVFSGLRLPAVQSRAARPLPTVEEVAALVESARVEEGLPAALFLELAAGVGCRQSELLALQPWDVRDRGATLYVERQRGRDGTSKPLKRSGQVCVARQAAVPTRLQPQLVRAAEEGRRLFPWSHADLRRWWDRTRERAGVDIEFKALRSFCASRLLDAGAGPIDVAVQLHGHTNPKTVLRYYAMVDRGRALERVREAMARS